MDTKSIVWAVILSVLISTFVNQLLFSLKDKGLTSEASYLAPTNKPKPPTNKP
jgi:hypothetical protein